MKRILLCLSFCTALSSSAFAVEQDAPIVLAQSGNLDYRVSVLEEQIRQMNGRIEELNFQLLEMQERMRRMQQDNEFRLEQIEEKQGNLETGGSSPIASSNDGQNSLEKPQPSDTEQTAAVSDGNQQTANTPRTIDGVEIYDGESGVDQNVENSLGTIQFDENGNIVDSAIGKPLDLTAGLNNGFGSPLPDNPDELFNLGYDYVQTGRYEDAEVAFIAFSQRHADHPRLPEARFWLGESFLGRGEYKTAAETYLDVHKKWPNGKYGPQSLLKLGVSVAGLNQRELACATFAEVLQKYPNASRVIRRSVAFEQRAVKCAIN